MFALILHVLQVIGIDILLSGDNAVVIALACRGLPDTQRKKGVFYGAMGALVLRLFFITIAVWILAIPSLKIIAALYLLWIAYNLISETDDGTQEDDYPATDKLWAAIRTVILADLIMSVDNIAAIASVAEASGPWRFPIMTLGLIVSIPLVVFSSQVLMKIMDKFPLVIPAGGILLGWVAGNMASEDTLLPPHESDYKLAILGATIMFVTVILKKFPKLTAGM